MPSNHLILCCPLLLLPLIFTSVRVFFNELALRIRWPKYWSFSFSISPSYEYSGLIPFRIDGFISFQSKGLSSLLQHYENCMGFFFFSSSWFVFSFCSPPTTHPTPPCPALPLSLKVFKLQTWNVKRKEILNIHARAKSLQSCRFCAPLWTAAHQAPLSVGFSRQEYWSGLLCCPPGDLPDPGIEPLSLSFPALEGRFFTTNSMDIHTTFWITCPELASKPGRLHYMLTPDFWRKGRSVARFYLTCSWLCV